jgi:Fe-S cluster assembly iron-binding protein IscA
MQLQTRVLVDNRALYYFAGFLSAVEFSKQLAEKGYKILNGQIGGLTIHRF